MTSPTVSVALCTHNGARFIQEQVLSILEQTVPVTQLVLSDDASNDDTIELALATIQGFRQQRGAQLPAVTVVRNAVALGVTGNFEQAITAATGEYVALSDQDDRWHPYRVEKALALFSSRPDLALVHSDAVLIDGNGSPLGSTLFEALGVTASVTAAIQEGRALELLARRNIVTGATVMFRRTLAEESLPFPASWVHDEWLAIVAAIHDGVDVVVEPLVDYRQHESNEIGAERLSVFGKFARMVEPGSERNARLLERAHGLADRFPVSSDSAIGAMAQEKLGHELVRSALSRHRLARVIPVLRELSTGPVLSVRSRVRGCDS